MSGVTVATLKRWDAWTDAAFDSMERINKLRYAVDRMADRVTEAERKWAHAVNRFSPHASAEATARTEAEIHVWERRGHFRRMAFRRLLDALQREAERPHRETVERIRKRRQEVARSWGGAR